MDGVILTPLKQIKNPKGDIFHAMKRSDAGYDGFEEAYFSTINKEDIKGWKKHTKMTLNIIVPVGEIEFIIYDEFVSTTNGTDVLKPLSKKINIISVNDMYHMMINILPTIHIESKLSKIQLHSSDFTADVVDHLENVL